MQGKNGEGESARAHPASARALRARVRRSSQEPVRLGRRARKREKKRESRSSVPASRLRGTPAGGLNRVGHAAGAARSGSGSSSSSAHVCRRRSLARSLIDRACSLIIGHPCAGAGAPSIHPSIYPLARRRASGLTEDASARQTWSQGPAHRVQPGGAIFFCLVFACPTTPLPGDGGVGTLSPSQRLKPTMPSSRQGASLLTHLTSLCGAAEGGWGFMRERDLSLPAGRLRARF
ncbi:hypothetical protein B0J12DRAFT_177046 [Macrophomina phaseolina]|uniref:Uncharacterized protein n=1 Tax=Macrophomina phaseolina TaxID=35725 RepID=A0ABQ8GT26_9PEZI|nr:hypothetical protein B0J12DRAFT_177046 [Macrophomina phaseolina]